MIVQRRVESVGNCEMVRAYGFGERRERTFGHKTVCNYQSVVFRVVLTRSGYEILQQEQISRTPLDDGEKPISQLQFPAPRVFLLSGKKISEHGIIVGIRAQCGWGT